MRLLDRYLLREFLIPLGFCLSGFLIFWIAFDLFSELHGMQQKHLLAWNIAEYYVFKTPEFLLLVLPVALLLALLYALTNHVRHNEITAIRAAGVSLTRLCLPYFVVGLTATLALFALDEFCVPITSEIADQILNSRVERQLTPQQRQEVHHLFFANARAHRRWEAGIYNRKTGEMYNVDVKWQTADGSRRSLSAGRAIRTNGVWTFYSVREYKRTAATNSLPVRLPLTNVMAFPEFNETPAQINSGIEILDRFGHPNRTHRADIPIREIMNYLRVNPHPERPLRAWLYTKLYGRFAGPCACLVVVLIAVPFAIGSGRRNVFVGVAASILIFFIYFLLQQFGFAFGEAGRLPAWLAAWLPDLAFALAGLVMMTRVR